MVWRLLALIPLLLFPLVAEAQLSVNKLAPLWIAPGSTKDIVITGTGFSEPVTVTMGASITINSATVNSSTQVTANVTAAGGAAEGTRNVRVTLADSSFFQRDGLLKVSEAFTLKGTTGGSGFTFAERGVQASLGVIIANVIAMDQEATTYGYNAAGTSLAQRQEYIQRTKNVLSEAALFNALILHADRSSSFPALTSTGVGLSPGNREAWVAAALVRWTNIGTELTALSAALLALENATTDPTAELQLNRARTIRIGDALIWHSGTDANQPYATPYPDDFTHGTSVVSVMPQVAAVHGNYRTFQWASYRAMHDFAEALENMGTIIADGQIPADTTVANQVFGRILLAYGQVFGVSLAASGHPDYLFLPPSGRPTMNPRFNIAVEGPDILIDRTRTGSAVFRINEVLANGISQWPVTGATSKAAYQSMYNNMVSGWGMNDFAAWSMIFFHDNMIPTQIAQAGDRQGEVLVTRGRYNWVKMEPPSFKPNSSMTVTITGGTPNAATCLSNGTSCPFENGMALSFTNRVGSTGTMGVTVDSVSVVSSTEIKARITAASDATPGVRDITLTPPAQVSGTATTVVVPLAVGNALAIKGGFSTTERDAFQGVYDGTVDLIAALDGARSAFGAPGVLQSHLHALTLSFNSLIEDIFKSVGYLINVDITNDGPAGGFASDGTDTGTLPGAPRSSWVGNAQFHMDRVRGTNLSGLNGGGVNHLSALSDRLTTAISQSTDAGVDATLTTARDTHLANAIVHFDAADFNQLFLTPWPDDTVGASAPSVVHNGLQAFTSHGGISVAGHLHARQCNYVFEAGEFYQNVIANGVFTSWDSIKGYFEELFFQFPKCLDQWATLIGAPVRTINPPPGTTFSNMNTRMAGVAEMWDLMTNLDPANGFIGGTGSINASLIRQANHIGLLLTDISNADTINADIRGLISKMVDSWRNADGGLAGGMDWSFLAPRAPTTRAHTALPSTAPTITSNNSITVQSGQAMAPFRVTTTGTTGAGPTQPTITVQAGTLPTGVLLTDHGNGVATLSSPTTVSGTTQVVTLRASNGTGSPADQSFTVTVQGGVVAPTFSTRNHVTFTVGQAGSFTITATGGGTITMSKTGDLPTGLTFTAVGSGSATVSGTATSATPASFAILVSADNGEVTTQNLTVRVQTEGKRGGGKGKL